MIEETPKTIRQLRAEMESTDGAGPAPEKSAPLPWQLLESAWDVQYDYDQSGKAGIRTETRIDPNKGETEVVSCEEFKLR